MIRRSFTIHQLKLSDMASRTSDISLAVLSICAVVITAVVVKERFLGRNATVVGTRRVSDSAPYAARGIAHGQLGAPITVVEFSDFQCPFCAQLSFALDSAIREFGKPVQLVHRHYPIAAIHPHARAAALASECAYAQSRFGAFRRELYTRQREIGERSWLSYADAAGVRSIPDFERCLRDSVYLDRLEEDLSAGKRLGVSATPTLLINDMLHSGTMSRSELLQALRDADTHR